MGACDSNAVSPCRRHQKRYHVLAATEDEMREPSAAKHTRVRLDELHVACLDRRRSGDRFPKPPVRRLVPPRRLIERNRGFAEREVQCAIAMIPRSMGGDGCHLRGNAWRSGQASHHPGRSRHEQERGRDAEPAGDRRPVPRRAPVSRNGRRARFGEEALVRSMRCRAQEGSTQRLPQRPASLQLRTARFALREVLIDIVTSVGSQLAVEKGVKPCPALSARHGVPSSGDMSRARGDRPMPCAAAYSARATRKRRRARWMRDITVPIGISSTLAISL